MVILRTKDFDGNVVDLDIQNEIDLRLDVSAIEAQDLGESFGIASQDFVLPGSDKNNQFFGNLYDLGATDVLANGAQATKTSFTNTMPCQVLYNGAEVFTGKLLLNNVITNQRGDTNYNVTVINETVDFKFVVEDKTFGDLDWSDYEHTFNWTNVSESWGGGLLSGDVIYPLVNYGIFEREDGAGNISSVRLEGGGKKGQFDNADSPLPLDYFKPAIRIKSVLDKIFESTEYTYTSSFFDSSYADKLYLLTTQDDKDGSSFINPVQNSAQAYFSSSLDEQTINDGDDDILTLNNENYDNGGNFNTSTYKYTAPVTGIYPEIKCKVAYQYPDFKPFDEFRKVRVSIRKNGAVTLGQKIEVWTGGYVTSFPTLSIKNVALNSGDTIEVTVQNLASDGVNLVVLGGVANNEYRTQLEVLSPTSLGGQTLNLQYAFNPEEKVTDFLKGLIQKFNLVIEPVRNERNVIRIEPFNDWVDLGEQKNWTDKVDRSVKFEIRHPLQEQPRNLIFTDLEDSDAINQYHKNRTGNIFGQQNYLSESDIAEGQQTIGSYFAATPCKGIPSNQVGQTEMIVPFLYEQEPGEYGKPYKFLPRILHTTGVKDVQGLSPVSQSIDVEGPLFYVSDELNNVQTSSIYASLNPLEDVAADFDETRDLHFGNLFSPGHYSYHQGVLNGRTKRSAWSEYWSFYINELYDVDSRLLTCNVFLEPNELQDIQLNDKIFIDGHYYRINKISGYNLTREDSVTVELLKTLPRKLKFPRRRIFDIIGEDPIDITLDYDDIVQNGNTGYVGYSDGVAYTGSGISTAGYRDGIQTFGTSSVWNTKKPQEYLDGTNVNFGNNRLDDGAVGVNVQGRNNRVSSLENTFVQGNENEVQGGVNVNVQGNSNLVEAGSEKVAVFNGDETNIGERSENITVINGLQTSITESSRVFVAGDVLSQVDNKESAGTTNLLGTRNTTISGSTNDITIIGSENINVTGGNFHVVIGKDDEVTSELNLDDYRFNTNVLNDTYLDDGIYLNKDALEVEAFAGGTLFAYSGDALFKYFYDINWSSVSGSGTYNISLPDANDAQQQPGRAILFKAGADITGSQDVTISVVGGGTIDGASSYTLNEPYSFVELVARTENRNSEWRVVRTSDGTGGGGLSSAVAYGSFYDDTTQALEATDTSQSVDIGNTYTSKSIALSGSGTIEMDYRGTYQFIYTTNVHNSGNQPHYANFWIKYNDVDYDDSNTKVLVPARKSSTDPSAIPVTIAFIGEALNDEDKIELYWEGDSTELSLSATTASEAGQPHTPSVMANIHSLSGGGPTYEYITNNITNITQSITNIGPNVSYDYATETLDLDGLFTAKGRDYQDLPITTLTGSDQMTSVLNEAFEGCGLSGELSLPNVAFVGVEAFKSNAITFVEMNGLEKSLASSFEQNSSLLSGSMTALDNVAEDMFRSCTSLSELDLGDFTGSLGDNCFTSTAFVNTDFVSGSTGFGSGIFVGNFSGTGNTLITASFTNMTDIPDSAFQYQNNLSKLNLPAFGTGSIGNNAFFDSALDDTEILTLASASSIGSAAFRNNDNLTDITFDEATSVGSSAFQACDNLESALFASAVTIGTGAFRIFGGTGSLAYVNLPALSGSDALGGSNLNNQVFGGQAESGSANIPSFYSSSNGGNPDGDVQALIDLGWTINYL